MVFQPVCIGEQHIKGLVVLFGIINVTGIYMRLQFVVLLKEIDE